MIYTVCGINIESAISLDEIFPQAQESRVDAVIKLVTTDDELADGLPLGVFYEPKKKGLIATHPSVGSFLMVGGKEIKVRARGGVPEADLANVISTTPLAALLLQRGLVALHASAIEMDQGAVVFMGPTATGKSSLATWFHQQKGSTVLADDLTVLSKDTNGNVWVVPGDCRLKHLRGVIRKWKDPAGKLASLRPRVRKQLLPGAGPGLAKKTMLRKIYLLEMNTGKEVVFKAIDKKSGSQVLGTHTYQSGLVTKMGLWPVYMKCLVDNFSSVPVSTVSIPRGLKHIAQAGEQLAQAIESVA